MYFVKWVYNDDTRLCTLYVKVSSICSLGTPTVMQEVKRDPIVS